MEWTNLNLQDILPTWQWWVQSADENRLELDWDYGPKFFRYVNGEEDHFNYTQIGAYNGGSSPGHARRAGRQPDSEPLQDQTGCDCRQQRSP